jgi:hypothetical protein
LAAIAPGYARIVLLGNKQGHAPGIGWYTTRTMETFDLYAVRLSRTKRGAKYALAVYPPTKKSEPSGKPRSQLTYPTIEQLCAHLNALQFGSENSLAVLQMALEGTLERAGSTFHIAHINEAGARFVGFEL